MDKVIPSTFTSRGRLVKGLLLLVSIHSREPAFAVFGARFLDGMVVFLGSGGSTTFRFLVELDASMSSS